MSDQQMEKWCQDNTEVLLIQNFFQPRGARTAELQPLTRKEKALNSVAIAAARGLSFVFNKT